MTRKDDLESGIRQSYSIIREYEATIQTSDRPEDTIRAQRAIDRQWSLIIGYLDEYRALTGNVLPDDIAQIAAHFGTPDDAARVTPAAEEPPPDHPVPQQHREAGLVTQRYGEV